MNADGDASSVVAGEFGGSGHTNRAGEGHNGRVQLIVDDRNAQRMTFGLSNVTE